MRGPRPGNAIIPNHHGDLPKGTAHSVAKMLALILGLGVLVWLAMPYLLQVH
jgi:hypothetical protein